MDESGRVTLDGVKVPESNISDLVSDAVRGRKNFNPVGSKKFFNILSKLNMPKDLVRNEERWNQAQMGSARDEGGSAQPTIPSKYFRTIVQRHEAKTPNKAPWLNY